VTDPARAPSLPAAAGFFVDPHTGGLTKPARAGLFLLITLPIVLIGAFSYYRIERELTDSAFARRQAVAHLAAMVLKEKLDHLIDVGVSYASREQVRGPVEEGRWAAAIEAAGHLLESFPFVERIFLTDPAGTETADLPHLEGGVGKNFSHRDWYRSVSRE
jgi:hypothetical protein